MACEDHNVDVDPLGVCADDKTCSFYGHEASGCNSGSLMSENGRAFVGRQAFDQEVS